MCLCVRELINRLSAEHKEAHREECTEPRIHKQALTRVWTYLCPCMLPVDEEQAAQVVDQLWWQGAANLFHAAL